MAAAKDLEFDENGIIKLIEENEKNFDDINESREKDKRCGILFIGNKVIQF
jgi:hypothetical protein